MAQQPRYSVVIPVHNEESILRTTCEDLLAALGGWEGGIELVLVENGSKDRTLEIANALAAAHGEIRVLREEIADYGNAVRSGLLAAVGETAVVFDCDLWDEGFASRAIAMLDSDDRLAVVVASKLHPDSLDDRSVLRRAGTRVFTFVVRSICGLRVSDTHGMKVISLSRSRDALSRCRLIGHVFDTELIVRLERSGLRAGELPCTVREIRAARSSYLSRVPSAVSDVWRLRRMLAAEARTAQVSPDPTR